VVTEWPPNVSLKAWTVALYEMTVSPNALRPCAVVVAHSAGAVSELATVGHRQIFIIDGFVRTGRPGAQNVNCFTLCGVLDAVPLLAHETMPASREVWRAISRQILQRAVTVAEN